MDVQKLSRFPVAPIDGFLKNYEFGKMLAAGKTSEFVTFRQRCREFIDRVVVLLLKTSAATSVVSKGLYSFCPVMMLEGDNAIAFTLFAGLCEILVDCGALLSDEAKAAQEEYTSFVVEQRRLHSDSDRTSASITDVSQFLLRDFSFQARHRMLRVFKMCCLIVGVPCSTYPSVVFDLSGSALSWESFHDCLLLVQSYVLSAGYSHQSLFSDHTMRAVRDAVLNAGTFFVAADFDLWKEFCGSKLDSFVKRHGSLYTAFLVEKRKYFDSHYDACNKANRLARVDRESKSAASSSVGSESEKSTKSGNVRRSGNLTEGSSCPSKRKSQEDLLSALDVSSSFSKKSKKKPQAKEDKKDPTVVHRIKKPSKN